MKTASDGGADVDMGAQSIPKYYRRSPLDWRILLPEGELP